jgi:hypothetical protein
MSVIDERWESAGSRLRCFVAVDAGRYRVEEIPMGHLPGAEARAKLAAAAPDMARLLDELAASPDLGLTGVRREIRRVLQRAGFKSS